MDGRVPQARYCSRKCRVAVDNAKRHEAKLQWQREHPGTCLDCGGPTAHTSERCRDCIEDLKRAQRTARRHQIEYLWSLGRSLREIAVELDSTAESVRVEISIMRREGGWDVPHRYAMQDGRRVAA